MPHPRGPRRPRRLPRARFSHPPGPPSLRRARPRPHPRTTGGRSSPEVRTISPPAMRESVDLRPAVPPAATSLVGRPLGEILRAVAGLSETTLEEALRAQADEGGRLGEVLVARKAVSADDV